MTKAKPKRHAQKRWLVFISHHGMDTWVAKRIEEKINVCGVDAFLDQTRLDVGDDFQKKSLRARERADEILALLTPWALTRPYVWTELGIALQRKIRIAGVLYGVKPEEPLLPEYMRQHLMVDINNLDRYLEELASRASHRGRR